MSQRPGNPIVRRVRPASRRQMQWWQTIGDVTNPNTGATILPRILRYGGTLAALSIVTGLLFPVRQTIGLLNIGMVFLIVVVGATVLAGRHAGIAASILGFALFNFFLVPPYLTFVISDLENILALFVFLGVSSLISSLIADAREQARRAQRRAEDVSRLYELSQAIVGAQRIDEVLPAIVRKVADVFETRACWLLLPQDGAQDGGRLAVAAQANHDAALTQKDLSIAEWVFRHGSGAEQGGFTTSPFRDQATSRLVTFVPLHAAMRTIGVLGVADKKDARPFTSDEKTVLATFADQAAVAIERLSLLREAQRAEMLTRTDDLKTALMSAVSHDLRTPLASIMASVTSLMEPGIEWAEETRRDFLEDIYDEARRLNRLVGNLLDMSRIEGGALHPEIAWYTIGEVIESVVQRLEPLFTNHTLSVQIDEAIPLLQFDFTHIDQVLSNLMENALNYTPPGTSISVKARQIGNHVEVEVADTGPGVDARHLAHLFDRFYQADRRRRSGGTGLGLALSKGLVEAHGGSIRATNRTGGGLVVTFTLPPPLLSSPSPKIGSSDATLAEART
ncbi:MAG: ATP-binding protein [Chloroflexia bacterium]